MFYRRLLLFSLWLLLYIPFVICNSLFFQRYHRFIFPFLFMLKRFFQYGSYRQGRKEQQSRTNRILKMNKFHFRQPVDVLGEVVDGKKSYAKGEACLKRHNNRVEKYDVFWLVKHVNWLRFQKNSQPHSTSVAYMLLSLKYAPNIHPFYPMLLALIEPIHSDLSSLYVCHSICYTIPFKVQ